MCSERPVRHAFSLANTHIHVAINERVGLGYLITSPTVIPQNVVQLKTFRRVHQNGMHTKMYPAILDIPRNIIPKDNLVRVHPETVQNQSYVVPFDLVFLVVHGTPCSRIVGHHIKGTRHVRLKMMLQHGTGQCGTQNVRLGPDVFAVLVLVGMSRNGQTKTVPVQRRNQLHKGTGSPVDVRLLSQPTPSQTTTAVRRHGRLVHVKHTNLDPVIPQYPYTLLNIIIVVIVVVVTTVVAVVVVAVARLHWQVLHAFFFFRDVFPLGVM